LSEFEYSSHRRPKRRPLVVALADDRAASEDVGTLARHADLVMPSDATGRVILASVLGAAAMAREVDSTIRSSPSVADGQPST